MMIAAWLLLLIIFKKKLNQIWIENTEMVGKDLEKLQRKCVTFFT